MAEKENDEINDTLGNEQQVDDALSSENQTSEKVAAEEVHEPTIEEQYVELNNKYIRLYSDFDNFRKRTIKEKADIISTASASLMSDLLGTLDDFERAISNNEKIDDPASLKEGFSLIYNKFYSALKHKGLEAMECKGEVFDADRHEAITNIPVTDEKLKGKIIDVIERGYNLRGKSLRYAKVIVGQ